MKRANMVSYISNSNKFDSLRKMQDRITAEFDSIYSTSYFNDEVKVKQSEFNKGLDKFTKEVK